MYLWSRTFQTIRPMRSLPVIQQVSCEVQTSPDYFFEGRNRSREGHCVFKYTLSGEGAFCDQNGEHRLPADTGFLVRINDVRTSYYYPEDADEPWQFIYAEFRGGAVNQIVNNIVENNGPIFQLPQDHQLIRSMLDIRGWDDSACVIAASWGAKFVNDLLMALVASKESGPSRDPGHELVRIVRQTIADRMQEDITVTQLAQHLNMSREYLARKFKEETGINPHRFIVRQKMLAACRSLKESTMNIKEISSWLGYSEPAHFTRTFRRSIGMTPTQFRREGHIPPG